MTQALGQSKEEPGAALAIYVHWPFCKSKCPYCDFNSHVRERIDQDRWRAALLTELDRFAARTPNRTVSSVFFGGGTPSLMPPDTVAGLLDRIEARWDLAHDLEITLEANPTSAEADAFAGFAAAGVNRLSVGVQALNDQALTFLGRQHTAAEARAALGLARQHFQRLSFDLIYARPAQSVTQWRDEMREALDLGPDHLSVYQLTIEPGTQFEGRFRRGELEMPEEELAAELYEATRDVLTSAGLPPYEISNHARPGQECRHNLTYWTYGDYLGVGPGAHGRLTLSGERIATRQHRAPEAWLDQVERQGHASRETDALDWLRQRDEMTMMGLRLTRGLSIADFERVLQCSPREAYDQAALERLTNGGFLSVGPAGLKATPDGLQRLDAVLAQLLS